MNPQDLFEAWKQSLLRDKERLHQENIVLKKFGAMFQLSNVVNITKEEFRTFLTLRNNLHWNGLQRNGSRITMDMTKLKEALVILLDESRDIRDRLTALFPPKQRGYIRHLREATVTPILMMTYPDKYGVWNKKTEAGLKKLGLFPKMSTKESFADQYVKINDTLVNLAKEHNVSLWKLDEILASIATAANPGSSFPENAVEEIKDQEET